MLVQTRPSGRRIFVHATSIKKIRQDLPIEISNRQTRGTRKQLPSFREDQHQPKFNSGLSPVSPRGFGWKSRPASKLVFFFLSFLFCYYFPIDSRRCGVITQMNSNGSGSDTIQTGKNQATNDSAARCNYLAG